MQKSCSFSILNMYKNSVCPAFITRPRSSGIQKFCTQVISDERSRSKSAIHGSVAVQAHIRVCLLLGKKQNKVSQLLLRKGNG